MKFVSAFALLATVAMLFGCTSPNYENTPKVQVLSDIELGQTSRTKFERLTQAYGAMYVTENGVGGGRAQGMLTLEEAKNVALGKCEEFNPGQDCILYAIVTP
ncbi:MAG: hypothetical protein AAGA63_04210 [Pseudomonadota bacterium]